jgi:hypothetical protein
MSLHIPATALTPADLLMLNRVLVAAGYRGTEAEVDPDSLSDAARFLVNLYHSGVSSEADLTEALAKRGAAPGDGDLTPVQIKEEAIDRWQDEGGTPLTTEDDDGASIK